MTDKQPEALRMADELDKTRDIQARAWDAAKELRRLHEVNAELVEALDDICSAVGSINAAKQHYFEVNGDGRYWQRKEWVRWILDEIIPNSRAAIAKAIGEQQ